MKITVLKDCAVGLEGTLQDVGEATGITLIRGGYALEGDQRGAAEAPYRTRWTKADVVETADAEPPEEIR